MGQKVHPNAMRLGIVTECKSRWIDSGNKSYRWFVEQDYKIRQYFAKRLPRAAMVSDIFIDRSGENTKIKVRTARPGNVIGPKGAEVEKMKKEIADKFGEKKVSINIEEVRKAELNSKLVAVSVAEQLEKRIMFRKAMKRAVAAAMRQGALGVKIAVSGRLGGAEIARTEWHREGRVPLHTLRADIDYSTAEAKTTYGIIGVKVWIFKGEIIGDHQKEKQAQEATA